jgi:hypothetical protein
LLDIDGDGEKEFVFVVNDRLNVVRSDLSQASEIEIDWNERAPRILVSVIEGVNEYPILFAQIGTEQYYIRYGKNRLHQYRALILPGIYIMIFGFIFGWMTVQDKLVSRRYEKDRLISKLQLQSIKNQLDPHFTYNALNAVGSLIYKEEKDLAYLYLKGLTDLLRMVSGDTADITWILSDELEFVKKYLEIEKLRFREKFNYKIEVETEALNGLKIPKMSILTFVENAIKHGLRHKPDDWLLTVRVTTEGEGVKIGIRDNGIGRAAALKYRDESTGQGIEMMRQYFKQFSEATGKRAKFKVTDLFEYDLKAAGTLVEITIT